MALIQIVDEHDQPVRGGTKQEAWSEGLYHRIVRIMLIDENGRVFIQHRAPTKVPFPSHWDNSVAGHVDEGETYAEAAVRELFEETGIVSDNLQEIDSYKMSKVDEDGRILNRFTKTYLCKVGLDVPIVTDPEEADDARWVTKAEARALIDDEHEQVTTGLQRVLEEHFL